MKWWVHGLYILLILVLGFQLFSQQQTPNDNGAETDIVTSSQSTAVSNASASDSAALDSSFRNESEPVPEASIDEPEAASQNNQSETALSQLLHREVQTDIDNRIENLAVQFDREPKDQDWAYQQEQNLSDLFIIHEELRDIDVESIDCRSSLCRIELTSEQNDAFTTMMLIQRALMQQDWYDRETRTYIRNKEGEEFSHTLFTENDVH